MNNYYSVFGPYIVKFQELKNSLGYKYTYAGFALSSFDRLALEKNVFEIAVTKELADEFCQKGPNESDKTRYNRIQILSQFARFLSDLGFRSYIPKLPQFHSTYTPYIFSRNQMQTIFNGFRVSAVKTGMLYSSNIIRAVAEVLRKNPQCSLGGIWHRSVAIMRPPKHFNTSTRARQSPLGSSLECSERRRSRQPICWRVPA